MRSLVKLAAYEPHVTIPPDRVASVTRNDPHIKNPPPVAMTDDGLGYCGYRRGLERLEANHRVR